mmetsp:Transcript_16893/g.18795  ORF Transcript_16893/g.18795 Transcript_16893/m.18795 type:complete len:591 (-) Transcript_16893:50-1822(-)
MAEDNNIPLQMGLNEFDPGFKFNRLLSVEEIETIAMNMYIGVVRKDRTYRLRVYKDCFVGKQAIDWMVGSMQLSSREEARFIGQQVLDKGIIFHVTHDHAFEDKQYYYSFSDYWITNNFKASEAAFEASYDPGAAPQQLTADSRRGTLAERDFLMGLADFYPDVNLQPALPQQIIQPPSTFTSGPVLTSQGADLFPPIEQPVPQVTGGPITRSIGKSDIFSTNLEPQDSTFMDGFLTSGNTISDQLNASLNLNDTKEPNPSKRQKRTAQADVSTSAPPSSKAKRGKKRKNATKSAEEKLEQRAAKSRNASRLYRQRKKAFVEQLNNKMESLTNENNKLMQDFQQQQELLRKLAEENTYLKNTRVNNSTELEQQRRVLLTKLRTKMKNGGMPQTELKDLLSQIDAINMTLSQLGSNHLDELISPTTVSHLVTSGFFSNVIRISELEACNGGIADFAKKVMDFSPNLSKQQTTAIEDIVKNHYAAMKTVESERMDINAEIDRMFQQQQKALAEAQGSQRPDVQKLLEKTATIELLRKNLQAEASLWSEAMEMILGAITLEQKAHFLLEVELRHASLQQLKYLWSAVYDAAVV